MKKAFTFSLLIVLFIQVLTAQQLLEETLFYEGETREYSVYIPANYQDGIEMPLLFNFHGGNDNIASQIAIADMRPIADTAGFIVVYPQALPDPNDGGSANWLHKEPTSVDDVFFVDAMIDVISNQYAINEDRIYACGYSLGGEFTYELACRLNDQIAAVGAVARTMGTAAFNNCSPSHPTGIITILGTADFISPYDGLEWNGIQYYLSANDMHDYWKTYNNTLNSPIITPLPNLSTSDGSTVEHHVWSDGDECVAVEHLKILGGGHDWPGTFGNMDIDASLEIWNYVSQYDLNGLINCNVTSVDETSERNRSITITPNPARDRIYIDFARTEEHVYYLYSARGNVIMSGIIQSKNTSIDLSTLPRGIYFLSIENAVTKFVKN